MTKEEIKEAERQMHADILDEYINGLLKKFTQPPFRASVEYWLKEGKITGSFRKSLHDMLDSYEMICEAAKDEPIFKPKWIDVRERLPDMGERVLVMHPAFGVQIMWRMNDDEGKWGNYYSSFASKTDIQFWQPLPEIPNE